MLVNTKEILKTAKLEKRAVPQFNINNLEWTKYILEEMEKLQYPVILGVSMGASKYMGGYNVVSGMVKGLIKDLNITIPVVLSLDHGNKEAAIQAIDAGFTNVMYDGSKHSLEQNLKETKEVVLYAHNHDVTVEAEVGAIGGEEDGISNDLMYAKLEDAILLSKTNIDSLAPAVGSAHGIYEGEPKLDFNLIKEISNKTNLPLVLHGGSGISDNLIKEAINSGICKVNINTELQLVWNKEVRQFINNNEKVYDPRKIISSGEIKIKEVINEKVRLLRNNNE
jgi:fructose-1,6-bisphosphate aldolase class II